MERKQMKRKQLCVAGYQGIQVKFKLKHDVLFSVQQLNFIYLFSKTNTKAKNKRQLNFHNYVTKRNSSYQHNKKKKKKIKKIK